MRPGTVLVALAMMASTAEAGRSVIYQLFVRHFSNPCETRNPHGTKAENGCGTFAGINEAALRSLRELGVTHVWLTGAIEQASATAYPGRPADDPDILKGLAGSPYAIKDYFDVCPDYAVDPAKRLDEFKELVERCHAAGLRVLLDFVPNHVSRAYASDVKPELAFGTKDDRSVFFARDNNFFYLQADHPGGGPPLRLPTQGKPGCDGLFDGERTIGRVTGNNVASWAPSEGDWYETVKLNYGHDYTRGRDTTALPGPQARPEGVPDTWRKMDAVIAYWQGLGVDGFRVDMAHMVPLPFWRWLLARAHERRAGSLFMAEAYNDDPAKLTDGNVLEELLGAGFDSVYDDAAYDILQQMHEGPKWANDLDAAVRPGSEFFDRALRYGENHDEVRLANPAHWGGHGAGVGRAVCPVLFALGKGPVMIYNGQETGEPAAGAEGFGGDDGRTTLFDYWSLPELQKWANGGRFDGGRLSPAQRDLRKFYGDLLGHVQRPALQAGGWYGLNPANATNPAFGRLPGENASGHWLLAFLRHAPESRDTLLVVANLHGSETIQGARILVPADAQRWAGLAGTTLTATDLLGSGLDLVAPRDTLATGGLPLPPLPPLRAFYFQVKQEQ